MLLSLLMVLVMACVVLAAVRAHNLRQSQVRVRAERDSYSRTRRDLR